MQQHAEQENDTRPAIAAAVIVQHGRVLLVRRAVAEGTLIWQFPAGAVEPGEPVITAAVRETAEETSLEVRPIQVLGERIHPATGRTLVYVACTVIAGTARPADDETADVAWAAPHELATYVPHGLYQPVQEHLNRAMAA